MRRARSLLPVVAATLVTMCTEPSTAPNKPSAADPHHPPSGPSRLLAGNGSAGLLIAVTALEFGEIANGVTSPQQTVNITNASGSPIVMSGTGGAPSGSFNAVQDCQGVTLNPGQSCHMTFTFKPTALGPATSTSTGTWNGQTYSISLHGTGVALKLFRIGVTALDFAEMQVGKVSPQQTVSITNITSAPIVMSGAGGAPPGDFNGVQDCQGTTLNPGQTCHMFFTFNPSAAGAATSTSNGSWNGQAFSIPLTGTGVSPKFRISPAGYNFGDIPVGTGSAADTVFITNIGAASVTMSGAGGAPPGDFNGVQDCQGIVLAVGQTCHMFFTFSPTTTGSASSASIGSWNGQSFNVALHGTGIAPGTSPSAQFRISGNALSFAEVQTGTVSPQQTVNITNITSAPIVMSGAGGAPPGDFNGVQDCQGTTLNPGQTCHMFFTFNPSAAGAATSTSNGSWNGQAFSIPLTGTGVSPKFRISPAGYNFGDIPVGTGSAADTVFITNIGAASVTMSGAGGAPPGDFNGVQDCQGLVLAVGQTCHMFFTFSPNTAGPASSSSNGSWNGQSFSIPLVGNGAGPSLLVSPVGFDFGAVPVGTVSGPQITNVTNVGIAPIVMSGAGGAPGDPFNGVQDCQGVTLMPGQTCHITYTFSPTATGLSTATSTGTWNALAYSVALQGTGVPISTFSGFLSPIDPFPALHPTLAGQAVPVKFSLGGNFGLEILAPNSPGSGVIACESPGLAASLEATSPAGKSSLTYDPLTDVYTYVWKTKSAWFGTCRQLVLTLIDGSTFRANFQFR